MASGCCDAKGDELIDLRRRQGRVLWVVLAINATLFVVEFAGGWFARSTALLGDSLDMLGDSFVYAFSLWVLHRGPRWRTRAALSKGWVQLGFAAIVLAQAGWKIIGGAETNASAMGLFGTLALAGNGLCFWLLWRHRSDDLNMKSTWLCSRNDLVANTAVIAAAGLVAWSGNDAPDVIVGLAIAALFAQTAYGIITDARRELRDLDETTDLVTTVPAEPHNL